MYRSNKPRMFKRAGVSAALAIGAVAGGAAVAGASTHHASAKAPSSRSHHDGWGTPPQGNFAGGQVTALTSTSITVKDPSGTSSTFTIDSSTKVTKERSGGSSSDLAVGEFVMITPSASSATTAASIDVELAHVAGRVSAVSGDTITVSDLGGVSKDVVVNSATVISKNGTSATLSDITVGSFIFAQGTFNAAATTLSASTLGIGAPGAGHGPGGFGPGDAGHGPGDPGQGPGAF